MRILAYKLDRGFNTACELQLSMLLLLFLFSDSDPGEIMDCFER